MHKSSAADLSEIQLQTLLISPPGSQSYQPHLGIPQLAGFLKSNGYRKLEIIDFQSTGWVNLFKLKLNHYRENAIYNSVYGKLFSNKIINKFIKKFVAVFFNKILIKKEQSPHSLNAIILSAISATDKERPAYRKLIKFIHNKDIKLIGFSVVYPAQLYHSLILSKAIKRLSRNIFIVMGGPQITKNIDCLIHEKGVPSLVDGFVTNDGEDPLAELIYQLEHSKELNHVPNFYFSDSSAKFIKGHYSFVPDKSCFIEPVFDKFCFSILPLRASLGCAWGKCAFCTYCLFHKDYLKCDINDLIKIIKNLKKKYRVSYFKIIDDFLPPLFLKRFSEELINERVNIKWNACIALVPGFNESIISLMERSGCKKVFAGLESMSGRILKLMKKPHTPATAAHIINLFSASQIKLSVFVIFGFPTETRKEADETSNFLKENKAFFENINIQQFCLEEDTIVFNHPENFGISKIYKTDKDYGLRLGYRFEVNSGMTQDESRRYSLNAIESFKD